MRWSRLKDRGPAELFAIIGDRVFPFLREIGGDGSTYSHHMRDARFTIPTPALLAKVVDLLDDVPMEGRDTKGDVYEYTLRCSDRAREGDGLCVFVRSLVGLDRDAATDALSAFVNGRVLSANQHDFVALVVEHLTANGIMEPELLYEPPFTDIATGVPKACSPMPRWVS